jgi:ABC-type dipeptide/oligopeptide/nickel transport system permease subunit
MLASLIAGLATGETMAALRRTKRALISYALAGLLALAGFLYLLAALTIWAADRYGAVEATLVIGAVFLVAALLVVLVHGMTRRARAKIAARQRSRDFTKAAIAAGIAAAPVLLKGRAGLASLLVPAVAAIAYAIYRENSSRPSSDDTSED